MKSSTLLPLSRSYSNASSFLISTAFHTVVLIVLALLPLALRQQIQFLDIVQEFDASEPLLITEKTKTFSVLPPITEAVKAGEAAKQSLAVVSSTKSKQEKTLELDSYLAISSDREILEPAKIPGALRPIPLNRKPRPGASSRTESSRASAADLADDPYVDVVRRFIQYDIGQLRGFQGDQAQRDFSALGEDAIPALVWGLNQAAYLNQSCPVIVIQSKLSEELVASDDPKYFRYALDHVGQGVPANAPYATRLQSFRNRLARATNGEGNTQSRKVLADQQRTRSLLVRRLARSPDELRDRLSDEDVNVRWAAARLTAARGLPLVNELASLLVDPDAGVRHEAHEALMRISRGEDYGPLNDMDPEDRQEAQQRWREWWIFAQQERKESIDRHRISETAEETANSALRMAETLERDGRAAAANRHYHNITTRFPKTNAAREARERLARR